MKLNWFKIGLTFILVILLQVVFFDDFYLYGYINPMIYIVFIMLAPFRINRGTFYLLSFMLGLAIDVFHGTGGIHASASLVIAFLRYPLLFILIGKKLEELELKLIKVRFMALSIYTFLLVFIHHFVVFYLDYFKFTALATVFYKTITTTFVTFIILFFYIIFLKYMKRNE